MAINKAEATALFRSMTSSLRGYRAVTTPGFVQPDRYALARQFWNTHAHGERVNFNDFVSVASRSIRALEAADHFNTPNSPPLLRRQIPFNYGIRANQPEFEYQVLVTGLQPGPRSRQEAFLILRSSDLLTAQDVNRLAGQAILRMAPNSDYRSRLTLRNNQPVIQIRVIAISRYEPQ